jgi:hypothetical protein
MEALPLWRADTDASTGYRKIFEWSVRPEQVSPGTDEDFTLTVQVRTTGAMGRPKWRSSSACEHRPR